MHVKGPGLLSYSGPAYCALMSTLMTRCHTYISALLTAALFCAGLGIGVMHPAPAAAAAMPCHAPAKATPESCLDKCISASVVDTGAMLVTVPPQLSVVVEIIPVRIPRSTTLARRVLARAPPPRPPLQITQRLLI